MTVAIPRTKSVRTYRPSLLTGFVALLVVAGGALAVGGALGLPEPAGQQVSASLRADIDGLGIVDARRDRPHEFYFTRAVYSGYGGRWGRGSWAIDYPKADKQFLFGLRRLTLIDAYEGDNPVALSDPELHRYPFLYALEVGNMDMSEPEVSGLRRYLQAGGFLFIDDFWGTWEWRNFESQIARALPDRPIVELPLEHPIFHVHYDIERIVQVPNIGIKYGGPTWEKDGIVPHVRGIFDEDGRLLVLINWNTDLGDAWEWVDDPYYPLEFSNYAYQLAVNAIVYAMSH